MSVLNWVDVVTRYSIICQRGQQNSTCDFDASFQGSDIQFDPISISFLKFLHIHRNFHHYIETLRLTTSTLDFGM